MSKKKENFSRRDFLKNTAGLAVIGSAGVSSFCNKKSPSAPATPMSSTKTAETKAAKPRAKVVLIRDQKVLDAHRKVNPAQLEKMIDDAVMALTGEPEAGAAWARLIRPEDTVGIKTNVWRFIPTPTELEQVVRQRVEAAGVASERIAIDDRGVLDNPVFQKATALINMRGSRTHHWSGVGSCIKNYIMFSPEPASWHEDSCANLAGVWDLPLVKGKTRLNVLVMLTPLFHGKGPHHFQPSYTWAYNGLVVGQDPVAVDATGLRILAAKRHQHFGKDEPFHVSPKHIQVAEQKFGLGVADPQRIDVIKLGWAEGALI